MSVDPGHKPEVCVPVQQPALIDTHTPVMPETLQVAEYEHSPKVELSACTEELK